LVQANWKELTEYSNNFYYRNSIKYYLYSCIRLYLVGSKHVCKYPTFNESSQFVDISNIYGTYYGNVIACFQVYNIAIPFSLIYYY